MNNLDDADKTGSSHTHTSDGNQTGQHNQHHAHARHDHSHLVDDFKKRFYISLIITIPILFLSPMIQSFLGVNWRFANDMYLLFVLSSVVFFLRGMAVSERNG